MSNQNSSFYALLIGINSYFTNRFSESSSDKNLRGLSDDSSDQSARGPSDGSYYKNLKGCVRDINQVEEFLNQLPTPPNQIFKLTASTSENNSPVEPPEQLPTYENIVKSFQHITQIAKPGDRIYIHYSGHGGRAKTIYPQLKGESGQDETLVPTDIGNENGRYLRDLELGYLLQQMVDKKLQVSVVLDCCHSGDPVRVFSTIDNTPRPPESLVASPEELIANWQNITGQTQQQAGTRGGVFLNGILPNEVKKGYVLLAACRPNEAAYEYAFEGTERNGALTYWLLKTLTPDPSKLMLTYQMLQDYIKPNINKKFPSQTPMLIGEGDRLILNSEGTSYQLAVMVMDIDAAKNRVQLQVGEATGVSKGAEFVIYSPGISDLSQTDKRVAVVQLTEVGAVDSWAEIKQLLGENTFENIEKGASSLLLNPGVKLVRKVRLLPTASDFSELENVKSTVQGHHYIELVSGDRVGDDFAYQVRINENGEYEILNKVGEPISNIRPALKVDEPQAAETLMKRLVHLAKYQTVMQLDNNDPASALAGKIKVELFKAGVGGELIPFDEPGNIPTVDVDEYAYIRIRNESSQTLNIAVLAMQPDWSIGKLHPDGADYEILERGQETLVRFNTSLPEGYTEAADILNVFATVGEMSFDWLKLPALDQPKIEITDKDATNPLEELFAAITKENPDPRILTRAVFASDEWTTEQVKLVVKKM